MIPFQIEKNFKLNIGKTPELVESFGVSFLHYIWSSAWNVVYLQTETTAHYD